MMLLRAVHLRKSQMILKSIRSLLMMKEILLIWEELKLSSVTGGLKRRRRTEQRL